MYLDKDPSRFISLVQTYGFTYQWAFQLAPVHDSLLRQSLMTFIPFYHQKDQGNPVIRFNTRTGFKLIQKSEILYCQADGNCTHLYLKDKKETLTLGIGKLEEMIGTEWFLRIHRSYIINLRYFSELNRKSMQCWLEKDGKRLAVKVSANSIRLLEQLF